MIVADGTGIKRGLRQFVFRNWALILLVVFAEEIVLYTSGFSDVLKTDVFSATAVGLLATVVGIFIVFRFNEAYQRWWEARILWGGLVNESRNFAREVMSFVTPDRLDAVASAAEAKQIQKALVYRHLAYCNALRLSLRHQDSWQELAPFLSTDDMRDLEKFANKPTRLTFLQGRQLERLFGTAVSESVLLTRIDETMNRLLNIQGGCERIKNTAFPDEVRFISKAMVWLSAVAIPIAFLSANEVIHAIEVVGVVVISLSFMVVEQLGEALKNPFENLDNDTPMTALCRTIEIDLRQQLGETEVPPPLEAVDGVLM